MKEFNSYTPDIIDPDADNPYGTFVDEGGGESGSPVLAAFMNTVKALLEKVMSEAGITYDDAVDTVTSCQSWDAFKSLFVDLVAAQDIDGIKNFLEIPTLPGSDPTTDNQAARKKYIDDLITALQAITITAGTGLTGGGDLSANRTINAQAASTSQQGIVQLSDSVSETSSVKAATPTAVKSVQDGLNTLDGEVVKTSGDQRIDGSAYIKSVTIGKPLGYIQTGNSLSITVNLPSITALSASRIALIDNGTKTLRAYDFNGIDWVMVGSALTLPELSFNDITTLTATTVAVIDSGSNSLSTYFFNGSTWSLVGSSLSIPSLPASSISALDSSHIALAQGSNSLSTYFFNGSTWSLVGSSLTLTQGGVNVTSVGPNNIIMADGNGVYFYYFNGASWELVFNKDITMSSPSVTAITDSIFVLTDTISDSFQIYKISNGFIPIGNTLDLSNIDSATICRVSNSMIAFIDEGSDQLRMYETDYDLPFSLSIQ